MKDTLGLLLILVATIILSIALLTSQQQTSLPTMHIAGQAFFSNGLVFAKNVVFFGMMKTLLIFFGIVAFFVKNKK